jgi:nicotinamide-nucleotide amidase
MNVHIITVGDEILIGQITDTNSAWIGQTLNRHGARIERIVSVGDVHEDIISALTIASSIADVVLITGGLGPTKDDITKKALADFFQVELRFSEPTYQRICRFFEQLGRSATEAHRQQCFMPENAELLQNNMGTAPAMWFRHGKTVIVSMPGVPYEMKYLMEHEVIPRLQQVFPGQPISHRTLRTAGEGESRIAERLDDFESHLPKGMKLAYLPKLGQVRLRLTYAGSTQEETDALLDTKAAELEALLPDIVYGYGEESPEMALGRLLKTHQLTLGTAESCTGGHIAHLITSIPGSSAYFTGAIIAYSNEVKMKHLGVQSSTLQQHGAVSEATVQEMVRGLLNALNVDIAIAVSGIAGPDGGTPDKPVGTIWMAVGNRDNIRTHLIRAGKDRLKNIEYASTMAIELTRRFILSVTPPR